MEDKCASGMTGSLKSEFALGPCPGNDYYTLLHPPRCQLVERRDSSVLEKSGIR